MLSGPLPACPLSRFTSWAGTKLPIRTREIVGGLKIVCLFRSKKAPFYHEYVVAGFGQDNEAPTSWIRVERAARVKHASFKLQADSHGPLFRGVQPRETLSISGSMQRLCENSNELACIVIENPMKYSIDIRAMTHQMNSTSVTNMRYQLFTANCRWFSRRGFLNLLHWCEGAKIPYSGTWRGTPASAERLQSKLEQERFGGSKISDGRGRGLYHRNMMNLALAQSDWGNIPLKRDMFDPYLESLEAASLEPNELAVLTADILTKRAFVLCSQGEPKSALVDAERATTVMRAIPVDAYRRGEQLSWSLSALSYALREDGRPLEAISLMEEAISIDCNEVGISFQLAMRFAEQAANFKAARNFEEVANSLKKSLEVLALMEVGAAWSDERDTRVSVLRPYVGILIELERNQDALVAQRELVATLRDLNSHNQAGDPEGFATQLLLLAAIASREKDHDEAVAAAREAVQLYRELPLGRGSMPNVLRLFGTVLNAQGRHEDAIAALTEAVTIQRGVGGQDAGEKLGQLLISLSDYLRGAGEMEAALGAAQDAVNILRSDWLEHTDDCDKSSALSLALVSCVLILQALGRIEEVVTFLEEIVELARSQGTVSDEDRDGLADKMEVLAIRYADLGRVEEAVSAASGSIDAHRAVLANNNSAANRVKLRDALLRYARFLSRFGEGEGEQASSAILEAVHLGERLDADEGHVTAIIQHMMHQVRSGAHEEALEMAASAIRVCSADLPDRRDLLSLALSANARALNELGRPAEAAARQEESLIIMRSTIDPNSPLDTSLLAQRLCKLAEYYQDAGSPKRALPPIHDGIELYRMIWVRDKSNAEDGMRLVESLNRLSSILFQLERETDAIATLDEETDVLRVLLNESPDFTLDTVTQSAQNQVVEAMRHTIEERPNDAMDAARQYLLFSRLACSYEDPASQAESLSQALVGYGMLVAGLGREGEAKKAMMEAFTLSRGNVDEAEENQPDITPAAV